MRLRFLVSLFLLGSLVLVGSLGCGGYRDKGINQDKDKPRPAETKPEPVEK